MQLFILQAARRLFTFFAPPSSEKMDKDEASNFLTSLLNKNLRITTTDGRLFLGQFKCTDPVSQKWVVVWMSWC